MPLAIDLFCGLGGWTEGLLLEGYDVIGFDIEAHEYGEHRYPAQLVIQDVLTLHGSQFKDASLIVASPPCQAYSYRAMPWKRAKALGPPCNALFESCFRIQREAIEAAGHFIPLVVENVCGAQKWVGPAKWKHGSFYLWGDVPALMPMVVKHRRGEKALHRGAEIFRGGSWFDKTKFSNKEGEDNRRLAADGVKVSGLDWSKHGQPDYKTSGAAGCFRDSAIKGIPHRPTGHWTNPAENGTKQGGDWFNEPGSISVRTGSKSPARKFASALIAKIPLTLSRHIAAAWK